MPPLPRRRLALAAALAALATAAPAQAIVGGEPATRAYPHMAQLRLDGDFICGASLVRAGWVLTAAHCVEDENAHVYAPGRLELAIGRTRLSSADGEAHRVQHVIQHDAYEEGVNDVALLRLAAPSGLAPIRVVTADEPAAWAPGVEATVIGWGATFSGGPPSDHLREVGVTIQSDQRCEQSTNSLYGYHRDTMLCAGETLGGRDSCQGDSGGPLMAPDARGRQILVGVVSGGVGCALPASYGIYARVGGPALSAWLARHLPPASSAPPPGGAPVVTVAGRLRARRGRVRLRLRTSEPLTSVRVRVTRRGRLVAKGRLARLAGERTVRLRQRRVLRRGRHRVVVRGVDAGGAEHRFRLRARR